MARPEKPPALTAARTQPTNARSGRPLPAAPPAYRPQPLQKCLQLKKAAPTSAPHAPPPAAQTSTPPNARTRPNAETRPNASAAQPQPPRQPARPALRDASRPDAATRNAPKSGAVQRLAPKVVQAIKLYPNLHPGAVERVEQDSVFKLSSFADQYRLRKTQSHGVYVPNQLYNFVRTSEGQTLLHNRYRHPSIAEGRQVLYAGEAYFNNGKLEWWSNGSGHYQPDSEDAQQAALPMDQFFSYQQVIKGEHKQRKAQRT